MLHKTDPAHFRMSKVSWNRVGQGPRAHPRPRSRGLRVRVRPVLAVVLAAFFTLWLVLPYDNTIRLAFRFNWKRFKAAWLSPAPSERWVYGRPQFPIDVGRDVVVIVKTGFGTRERVPAWLDALGAGNEFRDIMVIADSDGRIDYADEYHDEGLVVYDAVGHSLRLHLRAHSDHPRVKKYHQLAEALYKGEEALALDYSRTFGWELDAMKVCRLLPGTWRADR